MPKYYPKPEWKVKKFTEIIWDNCRGHLEIDRNISPTEKSMDLFDGSRMWCSPQLKSALVQTNNKLKPRIMTRIQMEIITEMTNGRRGWDLGFQLQEREAESCTFLCFWVTLRTLQSDQTSHRWDWWLWYCIKAEDWTGDVEGLWPWDRW